MKYRIIIKMFYVVIFFTGAAGLIYQVTWQRYLSRLLGSDSIATAIILGVFLGGLSTGYFICGKISLKVKNHFKAYALMEGIIGAWCLFFPQLFHFVDSTTKSWSFSPPVLIIFQGFVCSALLIGIPTICMGSTLPFLTRGIARSISEATSTHARIYAINTAGAFIGTLVAGFFLIPEFGLPVTILGTAFMNIAACFTIYIAQNYLPAETTTTQTEVLSKTDMISGKKVPPSYFAPQLLYAIAFLSGFYVMTLENVLIRITNLSMGSSSYSFSLVIAVFILSIAGGSYFIANRQNLTRRALYFNQLSITLSLLIVYLTLDLWPYGAHLIRIIFQSNSFGFWGFYTASFIVIMTLLILPIGFMGATVPLIFHEIRRELNDVGKHSGYLFSFNTLGSLCGSLIGGVGFYYFFDNAAVFLIAVLFAGFSTVMAARGLPKLYRRSAFLITLPIILLVILTPFYEKTHFAIGTFRLRSPIAESGSKPSTFYKYREKDRILFYKDGITATVAVTEDRFKTIRNKNKPKKGRAIIVNGKSDSHTVGDERTLKLIAHLPAIFSQNKESIMIVGLGTGMTAGEFTLYPEIQQIDVAEISPLVVEVLPFFSEFNHNLHKNPRVNIHVTDAFRFLGRTSNRYDIIISEPSNPWVTGIDQLFTEEFYVLVKNHLKPDGIFLQWIHTYDSDINMVGMVCNTVRSNFNFCHVFQGGWEDLLIMASMKDIDAVNIQQAETNYNANKIVRQSLEQINLPNFDSILLRELFENDYMIDKFKGFGLQTMDNPRLHYIAGKSFFKGSVLPNDILYNSSTAIHSHNYLLTRHHSPWLSFVYSPEMQTTLLSTLTDEYAGYIFFIADSLKLKNLWLTRTHQVEFTDEQRAALDLLAIVTTFPDFNDWRHISIKNDTYREKTLLLMKHVQQYRSWIFPYSISGLKAYLKEGVLSGADAVERNWCALKFIQLILNEDGNRDEAALVFNRMEKDDNGNIIVGLADEILLNNILKSTL